MVTMVAKRQPGDFTTTTEENQMRRMITLLATCLLVAGCAGNPKELALRDDTYCRSIGAKGSDYTNCRLFVTKQRADEQFATRMAIANAFDGAAAGMQANRRTICTTSGSYGYRTTTCN